MNGPARFPAFPVRLAVVVLVGVALGPHGFGMLRPPAADALAVAIAASLAAVGAIAGLQLAALPWRGRTLVLASIVAGALMIVRLGPAGPSLTASAWMTLVGICLAGATAAAAWLLVATSSGDGDEWVFLVGSVLMLGGLAAYLASSALCFGLIAGVVWSAAGPLALTRISAGLRHIHHPLVVVILVVAGAHLPLVLAPVVAVGLLAPGTFRIMSPGLLGLALAVDASQASDTMRLSGFFAIAIATVVVADAMAAFVSRRMSVA